MSIYLKILLSGFCGLLFGTIVWAWITFGTEVVIAYAAGVAMICF